MDALDTYEAKVRRRQERRSRALARTGKKRQEQRRRDASKERRAEASAIEAMALEDAAAAAFNRAYDAQAKQRAYDASIASFCQAARLRKRLQTYHLNVHTESAKSTASRITELQRRVVAHDARLALATVAQARLATVAQHHAATKTEIALESSVAWTKKMATALREANCDAFEHLIAHGAHPDAEVHGVTPLICAIATNHLLVARAVLKLGADPGFETSDGKTALLVAIVADDLHALALLPPTCLAHETRFGATGMLVACEKGRVAVVERLLTLSPDLVNATNALGLTPLMVAAKHNVLSLVRLLLTRGATPTLQTRNGDTAAAMAHAAGFLGAATMCSSSSALNAKREAKDMAATELGLARALDAAPIPSIFAYLRAHKTASPRYESPVGDMLLHVCCARGSLSDVRAALPLCPWFLPNRFGLTGAMVAAQKGRLDVLKELIAAGADLNQPDFLGRDCFYHLHTHGHDELAVVLGSQKAQRARQWWAPPPIKSTISLSPSSPLRRARVPSPSKQRRAPRSLCSSCQLLFARKLCTTCQCCYCDKCFGRVHFQAAYRHHTSIEMAPSDAPEDHEASWQDHLDTCHNIYENVLKLHGATSRTVAALVSPKRVRQVEIATIDAVVANQSNHKLHTAQLQLASVYRREGKLEDAKQQLETLLGSIRTDVDDDVAFLGHIYLEHARVLAARNETVAAIQRFEQALALLWTHVAMDDSHLCTGLDDYHHFLIAQSDYAACVNLAHQTLQRRLGRLPATHVLVHQARDKLDDAIGARERAAMRLEDKAAPSRDRLVLVLRSDDRFRAFCALRSKDAHVDLWRAIDALDPTERSRSIGFALYSQFLQTKKVLCLPSKVQLRLLARVDHSVAAADGSRKDKPLVTVFAKTKRILFEYLYTTAYIAYAAITPTMT